MNTKIDKLLNYVNTHSVKNIIWIKKDNLIYVKRNKRLIYIPSLVIILVLYMLFENTLSAGTFFNGIMSPFLIIGIFLFIFYIYFIFNFGKPLLIIDDYNKKVIYNSNNHYFGDIKNISSKFFKLSNYEIYELGEKDSNYIFIKLNNKNIKIAEIEKTKKAIEFKKLLKEYFLNY